MRVLRYVCALVGAGWALLTIAAPALAEVEGPCTATVAGTDVTAGRDTPGSAIDVQADEPLEISGTAEGTIRQLVYTVRIAGGGVNVGNVAIRGEDGRIWEGTVDLDDFSWAGVGLFEVTADVETAAGPCEGRVYICIEGRNPLTTAAGGGSAAVGAGGVALLAMSLVRSRRMGAVSSAVQGFVGGAATAAGAGVLLQQFCAVPLTLVTAAVVPAGVGVMGSVASYGMRRAGRAGARRALERVRPRAAPGGGGAPAGEPTEVLDRGARELERAGRPAAERSREAAESIRASVGGGPSPAPPPGGGAPAGPAPAPPGGGGAPAGPAPAPPAGGGGVPVGPAPAPPAGGGPPAGPTPAPGGGPLPGPTPAGAATPVGPTPAPPPGTPTAPSGAAAAGVAMPPAMPAASARERTCSNCGTVNPQENRFCTNCGSEL